MTEWTIKPARSKRRWLFWLGIPVLIVLLLFLLRYPILRVIGNYLVAEDEKEKVDAIFVLSGSAGPRAWEAAKLYKEGWADKVICTGEEVAVPADDVYACTDTVFTCDLTRRFLIADGVDSSRIIQLMKGTSTYEEALATRDYCKQMGYQKIMVVSSNYHTRRIRSIFRKILKPEQIGLIVRGAEEPGFNPDNWWRNENGLVSVNVEYQKILFYKFKY